MSGLTIGREVEIISKRLEEKLEEIRLIINNNINLENIGSLLERIELLQARILNLRNRINNSN